MRQVRIFGDERELCFCAYCGGGTETRDHVPSKVLLDRPFPGNLPVVGVCKDCNEGLSLDEEYLACLVDCALTGSVNPDETKRARIASILSRKPALSAKLALALTHQDGKSFVVPESKRVQRVIRKLGCGHSLFHLHMLQLEEPTDIWFAALVSLTQAERQHFETPPPAALLPEVGSRALIEMVEFGVPWPSWIEVQEGRYRCMPFISESVGVRMVLSEYLACEVTWSSW